jgi:hypothetical protein
MLSKKSTGIKHLVIVDLIKVIICKYIFKNKIEFCERWVVE